jgi:hypothetical protein
MNRPLKLKGDDYLTNLNSLPSIFVLEISMIAPEGCPYINGCDSLGLYCSMSLYFLTCPVYLEKNKMKARTSPLF